jgi:hypothetical protein
MHNSQILTEKITTALGNKTPAEICGIKVEGKNKWKTLIQNASKNLKTKP